MTNPADTTALVNLLASRFIQRREPFAVQNRTGGYMPMRGQGGFTRAVLEAHLSGVQTAGHYLLDESDHCKVFVLDIDLIPADPEHKRAPGYLPTMVLPQAPDEAELQAWWASFIPCYDLRTAWHDRSNLAVRQFLKRQMREMAAIFTSHISNYMQLDTAAAYSGNKGIHVYGFVGSAPAKTAREYAELLMTIPGWLAPLKGNSFYTDSRDRTPETYGNWHFEIYPKQSSLDGKDLGNLIRLPLGRNMHNPQDPTFFIDLTAPLVDLVPVDPVHALSPGNAWRKPHELAQAN